MGVKQAILYNNRVGFTGKIYF